MTLEEKVCGNCGFSFLPKRRSQEFCSVDCRNAHTARASAKARGDAMRGRRRTGSGRYPKLDGKPAHRAVAEATLGRPLREGEVVHHLSGDKSDYSSHNVIVVSSQSEHARIEAEGRRMAKERGQRA